MLEIDFIGYDGKHSNGFVYGLPPGHESYLLLLISTPGEFLVDGEFRKAPAGSAILYTPGSQVLYRACEENYCNDWVRFRCDENFIEQLPVRNIPFPVSDAEYCHNLLKLMTWESALSSSESRQVLSHLFRVLFLKLGESCKRPAGSPHSQKMLDLRKHIYNNPEFPWNVDNMAKQLHLSTGYLQTLYKSMFGSSCMEDVILQRLRRAQDQLVGTDKSVREIAENCGYNNVEHFCRQFRKFVGISPSRYRHETPSADPSTARHLTHAGDETKHLLP